MEKQHNENATLNEFQMTEFIPNIDFTFSFTKRTASS